MQISFLIYAFFIYTLIYKNATTAQNKGWMYWNFHTKQ